MNTLYDSDTYCLIHVQGTWDAGVPPNAPQEHRLPRHGFELRDKRSGKELYLDGPWAELFQEQLHAWQRQPPTEDEVEDTLTRYAGLAQIPTSIH